MRELARQRPQLVGRLIYSFCGLVVTLAFWRYGHPHLRALVSRQADTRLALILYLIGGLFALMGLIVSIKPPGPIRWKITSVMVFLSIAYIGFLVVNEQGIRTAEAAKEAAVNKRKYDDDVERLENKIDDTQGTIAIFAKNSPDPARWNALLSEVNKVGTALPTLIIPPASSGNLKERALSLVSELNGFVAYRQNFLQKRYAKEVKHGESRWPIYKSWDGSTSGMYRQLYEQRVIGIVSELAALHLRDQRLDEDLEMTKELEQAAQLSGNRISASVDLFSVQDISDRLAALAKLLPAEGA